jgi:hypothetical protein
MIDLFEIPGMFHSIHFGETSVEALLLIHLTLLNFIKDKHLFLFSDDLFRSRFRYGIRRLTYAR